MVFPDTTEAASPPAFLTVVYLGTDVTATLVARLRSVGIGVVVADTVQRGLQLLKEFRVAAVIFALPDLQGSAQVAASDTPLILLAAEDAQWDRPGVTVMSRGTDAAVLGLVIRTVIASRSHDTVKPADCLLPAQSGFEGGWLAEAGTRANWSSLSVARSRSTGQHDLLTARHRRRRRTSDSVLS